MSSGGSTGEGMALVLQLRGSVLDLTEDKAPHYFLAQRSDAYCPGDTEECFWAVWGGKKNTYILKKGDKPSPNGIMEDAMGWVEEGMQCGCHPSPAAGALFRARLACVGFY